MLRICCIIIALLLLKYRLAEAAQCACATDALHIRDGAGTSHTILGTVSVGTCVPFQGDSAAADGYTWDHVDYNGKSGWAASNWLTIRSCEATSGTGCHGDINNLHTTGIRGGGVAASQHAVALHINTLNSLKSCYEQVAHTHCIEASVIAGIASRESNGGDGLTAAGYGDQGHAWGIMQCDLRYSGLPCKNCPAKSCCHIDMLVGRLLIPMINTISARFPSWTVEQKLQAAISSYNAGTGHVHAFATIDVGTTGGDYSSDVVARAQYLKNHYGWS